MGTLVVVTLSLLIGAGTYAATIRSGRRAPAAVGFDAGTAMAGSSALQPEPVGDQAPEPSAGSQDEGHEADVVDLDTVRPVGDAEPPPAPPVIGGGAVPAPDPGYTYLQVSAHGPGWRDRVAGVVGLIVILAVGSAVLAFALYQAGSIVNATIERFFNS